MTKPLTEEERDESFIIGRTIGKIWDAYNVHSGGHRTTEQTVLSEVLEELRDLPFLSSMSLMYGFDTSHLKLKEKDDG